MHTFLKGKRVGYWLSEKKIRKLNFQAFAELCRKRGVEVVQFQTFSFLTGSSHSPQLPAQLVWLELVAREGSRCPEQMNAPSFVDFGGEVTQFSALSEFSDLVTRNRGFTERISSEQWRRLFVMPVFLSEGPVNEVPPYAGEHAYSIGMLGNKIFKIEIVTVSRKTKETDVRGELKELAGTGAKAEVELDLTKPIEDQGPLDVIIHKLTDVILEADQNDSQSLELVHRFQEYIDAHPETIILDPLPAIRTLLDRSKSYELIRQIEAYMQDGDAIASLSNLLQDSP
ncbi:hypothetical protein DUI87_25017 [Hirundo rustica rustica]|uniref:Inositol-tetrakisphosphate 1-kinase N-terminal domain-containing protein n=1 Tax=Hirundo rustica rustica TaxID=333673 RepID=A0A3M0JD70_HIRRU|nr:hypothetical protein DUI87_25017 [Hirundo rustica rustica]